MSWPLLLKRIVVVLVFEVGSRRIVVFIVFWPTVSVSVGFSPPIHALFNVLIVVLVVVVRIIFGGASPSQWSARTKRQCNQLILDDFHSRIAAHAE